MSQNQTSIPIHQWTNGDGEVLIVRCIGKDGKSWNGFQNPMEVGARLKAPDEWDKNWGPRPEGWRAGCIRDDQEIEARLSRVPEGPWFAASDPAKECGPHRDSGLALVDTGRDSDWPIARLCEWHKATFIAHSREDIPRLIASHRALAAERDKLKDDLEKATDALRKVASLPLEEIV